MERPLERSGYKSEGGQSVLRTSVMTEVVVIAKKVAKISDDRCGWDESQNSAVLKTIPYLFLTQFDCLNSLIQLE